MSTLTSFFHLLSILVAGSTSGFIGFHVSTKFWKLGSGDFWTIVLTGLTLLLGAISDGFIVYDIALSYGLVGAVAAVVFNIPALALIAAALVAMIIATIRLLDGLRAMLQAPAGDER